MDRNVLRNVIKDVKGGVSLDLWIQPRASKTVINGLHGDALKVSIAALPVDGKANSELISYLSKCLSISKSLITITSGKSSRKKRIFISGLNRKAILKLLSEGD